MTKTKIRISAAFSSLVLVGLAVFGYQVHYQIPLLKAANTSALTSNGSAAATSGGGKSSSGAIKRPAAIGSTTPSTVAASSAAPTAAPKTAALPPAVPANGARSTVVADSVAASAILYANPNSNIAAGARAWAAANPGDAGAMNRLAATPMANWFGDFSGNVQAAVNTYVSNATNAGGLAEVVAYNIPHRDCGSYSAGGATSADAYQSWIASLAAGIGMRQAIVILEPDALAGMDCLSAGDQASRLQLLSYAVDVLQSKTKAAVYLDAGNSGWQSVATMASRLRSAGVAEATGFSLNVSNFETTSANASYGTALAAQIGGKHFVVDTSRNGNGAAAGDGAWCNPDGRAFGSSPTLHTGQPLIDGYLWVKGAGESDGACGPSQASTSAPGAGAWWPQYALMLEHNSGW